LIFIKHLFVFSLALTSLGTWAKACPGSLRSFNKTIHGKKACVLENTVVGDLTLTSGFNYVVLGRVFIGSEIREKQKDGSYKLKEDVTPGHLVVQPGVKIYSLNPSKDTSGFWKGMTLSGSSAPVLGDIKPFISVTRDSSIEINGTQSAPVLMTSAQGAHLPKNQASQFPKKPGDWGGLVINGYGRSNKCTTIEDCTLRGEADTGFYGGDDDEHSSGSISYLQIEYAGDQIDDKKQLNGLTLNGIGVGMELNNIAVLFNADDCIEFFGGAAIVKNLVCYKGLDDGIDSTDGARTFIQNAIIVSSHFLVDGENDRHAVEADSSKNPVAHKRLKSSPLLVNVTFIGGKNSQGLKLRRSTQYRIVNSVMTGFDLWCVEDSGAEQVSLENNVFTNCTDSNIQEKYSENIFNLSEQDLELNNWAPSGNSPLLSGAKILDNFADDEYLDEFFGDAYDEVDYIGGIGYENWASWVSISTQ